MTSSGAARAIAPAPPASAEELRAAIERAAAALAGGDLDGADAAMAAAAAICRRMEGGGIGLTAAEKTRLREIYQRAGAELIRLTAELNVDSARRRGLASYRP